MAPRKQTEPEAPAGGGGALGNPTTLLLIILAAVFLFWNMRRRRAFEERMQAQRREQRLVEAEQSAREVANVMRNVPAGAAAAAATEGLASAARMPAPPRSEADGEPAGGNGASPSYDDAAAMRALERSEATAEADRAAAEAAQRIAHEAETGGRSEARRQAAAAAAAEEVRADDAETRGAREADTAPIEVGVPPAGAIAGDGTDSCPDAFPIKGNASSRIYHEPGQSSYANTIPEYCFESAAAAEAAGFRQSRARGQRVQK